MSINWNELVQAGDHRPWPCPSRPWVMTMSWVDALLVHWPVARSLVASTVPDRLAVDTWNGRAWLTVVAFEMTNTAPRGLTWLPQPLHFPELNLRTYVSVDGEKPGVWFYSLDAASRLAVLGGRTAFNLPYFRAEMSITRSANDKAVTYASCRMHRGAPGAQFQSRYHPTSAPSTLDRESFAAWLVERYCLYSTSASGHLFRGDVQHRPWELCEVEFDIAKNTLARGLGVDMSGPPAAAHFAHQVDVVAWWPTRVPAAVT